MNLDTCAFYDRADVITIQPGALFTTEDTILYGLCSNLNVIQNCICFFFKMVRMCAFPGCFNRQKAVRLRPRALSPGERLTFHRFPLNDPERLRLWLLAVQRDISLPIQSLEVLRLCSEHFSRDDFKSDEGNVRRYLKSTAVPVLLLKIKEGEDEETVTPPPVLSEKIVKTGEKGTSPAPRVIKLEKSHAALDNVSFEEEDRAQSNGVKK